MIYLDSSVLLAELLSEDRRPPTLLWDQELVSSRLIEYEVWRRLHALEADSTHGEQADDLLGRVDKIEMTPTVLARALGPFALPVRTLDGLHLSSMLYLVDERLSVEMASYDRRLLDAATAASLPIFDLD